MWPPTRRKTQRVNCSHEWCVAMIVGSQWLLTSMTSWIYWFFMKYMLDVLFLHVKFKDVLWAHVLWAITHVYIICWVIQHKNMQLCLHRSWLSFFHLAHGDAFAKSGILLEERSCSVWPLWQEPYSHMRSLHAPRYHRRPNVCAKHASQTSLKLTHQQKAEASTLPNY